jgi:hypothetical protein
MLGNPLKHVKTFIYGKLDFVLSIREKVETERSDIYPLADSCI